MSEARRGIFTISLDFELAWGFLDWPDIGSYVDNLRGGRAAIPRMLQLFQQYGVHATWATVGFLLHRDQAEFQASRPDARPAYEREALDPYAHVERLGTLDPELYFAPELVEQIRATDGQEIGSHTYCHYYGLEPGQNRAQFQSDLEQAAQVADRLGLRLKSLVFPRNQSNPEYLSLLPPAGIRCYRGNEQHRLYRAAAGHDQKLWMRAARLLDAYLPLTGHNVHDLDTLASGQPFNIPASRFLRPHAPVAAWFEPLRKRRITRAMEAAARTGGLFHLWWHPHNFGRQTETNLAFLDDILAHFEHLRDRHGMRSLTMSEVADVLRDRADQRRTD